MKILLLVDSFWPQKKAAAIMMHELAIELVSRGHEIYIVTPDYNLNKDLSIEIIDKVNVVRVRTGKIKNVPKFIRAFNEIRLSNLVWKRAQSFFSSINCDLIVFYSPTIFWGRLIKKLKSIWSCPSYLIIRDIFPQWAIDAKILRKGLAYFYFKKQEELQYEVANIIAVQSEANLKYFTHGAYRKWSSKLEVLYNWSSTAAKDLKSLHARNSLGLMDKVVFFYGGNIGEAQGMQGLITLAYSLTEHKRIHFLVVGDGSYKQSFQQQVNDYKLSNITIHDAVEQDDYFDLLKEFDVGMVFLGKKLRTHNFPGKILGYMYFSMPIIASINPGNDLKNVIETAKAGFVTCNTGDNNALKKYVIKLAEDNVLRTKLGRNARILLETRFSVKSCANQVLDSCKHLAKVT